MPKETVIDAAGGHTVSLHGTLETFALPDVLALLAATKKHGELRVVGEKTDGRVWFDAGHVVEADVGRPGTLVDAVFELLRLESGKFSFDPDVSAPSPGDPAMVEPLLAEAQDRLREWHSITAVIPSLACEVRLAPEVREGPVTVTGDQWRVLVGVASTPSVRGVLERLGLGEFDGCRALKGLVEAGLTTVEESAIPSVPEPVPQAVPQAVPKAETVPQPVEVEKPVAVEKEEAPAKPKPKVTALISSVASSGAAEELVRQVVAMEAQPTGKDREERAPTRTAPSPPKAEASPEASVEAAEAPDNENDNDNENDKDKEAEQSTEKPGKEAAASGTEEPINRGLLLKFLSSVRT